MKQNSKKAAEVKKVAKAEKKNVLINEAEVKQFIDNRPFDDVVRQFAQKEWDGQTLEEDRVYHLNKMAGLKVAIIKDNRRTWKRGVKMMSACMANGMTTPAILVLAKLVSDWGLAVIDPTSGRELTADELDGVYCVMEGHGRLDGWVNSLVYTSKQGGEPFDYHFIYKHYDTPEDFGKAYVSTNADMTRTTSKDRLTIAGARSKNPTIISYLNKIKNDGTIAKASFFWTCGRELSKDEVTKLTYEMEDAPTFDQDTTDALALCYESFKARFSAPGAETVYRGVSAAQWCADRINKAEDKNTAALTIAEKVQALKDDLYSPILTAKTNRKKHITRDQAIKTSLDLMMQAA